MENFDRKKHWENIYQTKDKLKDAEYQFEKGTKPQLLAEDKT